MTGVGETSSQRSEEATEPPPPRLAMTRAPEAAAEAAVAVAAVEVEAVVEVIGAGTIEAVEAEMLPPQPRLPSGVVETGARTPTIHSLAPPLPNLAPSRELPSS